MVHRIVHELHDNTAKLAVVELFNCSLYIAKQLFCYAHALFFHHAIRCYFLCAGSVTYLSITPSLVLQ